MSFRLGGRLLVAFLIVALQLPASADPPVPADKKRPEGEKPARIDRHGDPLPPGAVARLGTARLRALCGSLHFSADGKTLVGVSGGRLVRIWDAAAGDLQETRCLPVRPEGNWWALRSVRSSDGNTLVIGESGSPEMWDIPSGKRLDLPLPKDRKRLACIALSDDRRLLFLGETGKEEFIQKGGGGGGWIKQQQNLLLWDTATGKLRVLAEKESSLVALAVSPDGKHLASSSYGQGTRVWDAAGKVLWRQPRFNAEEVAFTPDGRHLIAAPGGGQNRWHVWDAATGQPSTTLQPPTVGYAWTFTLAPDGSKLLIPTVTDYVLWDLKGGKVLHRWPGAKQAGQGAFSPDGRSVVTYLETLQRWDVATGNPLYADVSALGHVAAVRGVCFTPDGQRLVSIGQDETVRIWDRASARLMHTLPIGPARLDVWALTPDGNTLVGVDEQLTVHQWSIAEGRLRKSCELREAKDLDIGLRARHARVTPDGKTLAVAAWPRSPLYRFRKYSFSFWDLETGRLQRWGGDPGEPYEGEYSSLAPDGRFAARQNELYDTRSGERRLLPVEGQKRAGGVHVFSPDGRLLAATANGVRVWETLTGQTLIDLPPATTRAAAFAPTGRLFAFVDERRLVVCDLQTGKIVLERTGEEYLRGTNSWVTSSVAFSPDGRTLATGHPDGTILVWDVPGIAKSNGGLTERDAAALWDDLAHDAARGYAAVWRFRDDPPAAVRFLSKQLERITLPAQPELKKLVANLDSERFEDREAASRRLERLGGAVEPFLRQVLKDKPTPEQRRRIEELLGALTAFAPPKGDNLRAVRAVAIVEGIHTAEARQVLEEWARGSPEAWLTQEAKAALERLAQRPPL